MARDDSVRRDCLLRCVQGNEDWIGGRQMRWFKKVGVGLLLE
jgi:hypothetical protein